MNRLPPPRILVAVVVTLLAALLLVVTTVLNGDDESGGDAGSTTTSSSTVPEVAPSVESVETSVVVAPDWYAKGSSRYSDRSPAVTITTLAPTTTAAGAGDDDLGGTRG